LQGLPPANPARRAVYTDEGHRLTSARPGKAMKTIIITAAVVVAVVICVEILTDRKVMDAATEAAHKVRQMVSSVGTSNTVELSQY